MSAVTVAIKDEDVSGTILNKILIEFASESVRVRDIIEARVRQEVETFNERKPEYFNGLIEPSEAEKTINGYKLKKSKKIDAEKQVYVALDAFQKNGFFVLIDDQQYDELEQEVMLSKQTEVSFVKLTPLVGG